MQNNNHNEEVEKEFEEVIVNIGRVTKVVKGGRRFRFTALVVIGDKKGTVGYGFGKAKEVPDAIKKAVDDAHKNLVKVNIKGTTIAHDIEHKFNASRIVLRPASEGTGVIAGGATRPVLELAGIQDILIITTPEDQEGFIRMLGNGSDFGINLTYKIQPSPDGLAQAFIIGEEFIGNDSVCLVLGDNIFWGQGFTPVLKSAASRKSGASVFGYQVKDPERFGVVAFDENKKALDEIQKITDTFVAKADDMFKAKDFEIMKI